MSECIGVRLEARWFKSNQWTSPMRPHSLKFIFMFVTHVFFHVFFPQSTPSLIFFLYHVTYRKSIYNSQHDTGTD